MFPRQPVTHKHLPQAIETSAMCVCVLVLLCVRCLAEQVHCSPTSTVNLALTLEQPGHVASPLSDGTAHTTLPPAAPELLMDTWACCCRALIFQLLCLPLPLFSPHSPPPSYLAAQCTSSKGLFSTFTEIPPPLCLK